MELSNILIAELKGFVTLEDVFRNFVLMSFSSQNAVSNLKAISTFYFTDLLILI